MRPKTKADLASRRKPAVSASAIRQEPVVAPIVYSPEFQKAMDDDMLHDRWFTIRQIAKKLGMGYSTIQARYRNEPGVVRGYGDPRIPECLFIEVGKRKP